MSESSAGHKFLEKQKKLEGLTIVPNDEAVLLEKTLGISFGESKPAKIKMDAAYKKRIYKEITEGKNIVRKGLALLADRFMNRNTAAQYSPEWDAYVCLDKDYNGDTHAAETERMLGLHENMHGWIQRQNEVWSDSSSETFLASMNSLLESLQTTEQFDKETVTKSMEKYLLAQVISEGICNFAAVYTGFFSDEITEESVYVKKHISLTFSRIEGRDIDIDNLGLYDFDEQSFLVEVHDFLKARDKIVEAFMAKKPLLVMAALEKAKAVWYELGYKLVQTIVQAGEEQGKTVGEMLTQIVTQPYEGIGEIIDVEELEKQYQSLKI